MDTDSLPTISVVIVNGNPQFQVCGHGFCHQHRDRWQAELYWESACILQGLPLPPSWRSRPLGRRTIAT
jgi:hypothetical protein